MAPGLVICCHCCIAIVAIAALTFNKCLNYMTPALLTTIDLFPKLFVLFSKVSGTQFVNAQLPEKKGGLKMSE